MARPSLLRGALASAVILAGVLAVTASGQPVAYTDEAQFLADLAAAGYCLQQEGFEDDSVWGDVRSTVTGGFHTAPSITNLDVTWMPNNSNGGVTTGEGAARTGQWGFYEYPHGDFANGIADGFVGVGGASLFAVGGWLRTNTPGARIVFLLDGTAVVDFDGANALASQHLFFGVIEAGGFTAFEVQETEGVLEDQKLVFADDFRFGRIDCREGEIFTDGFESGDTSAWSGVVP